MNQRTKSAYWFLEVMHHCSHKQLPTAICRPATDLHLNICVREVVLWRQLPIVVDEVVENRWAEHWLKKQIRHFTANWKDYRKRKKKTVAVSANIIFTCVSKKMTLSCVMKKSMPVLWFPPLSLISWVWARNTYPLCKQTSMLIPNKWHNSSITYS